MNRAIQGTNVAIQAMNMAMMGTNVAIQAMNRQYRPRICDTDHKHGNTGHECCNTGNGQGNTGHEFCNRGHKQSNRGHECCNTGHEQGTTRITYGTVQSGCEKLQLNLHITHTLTCMHSHTWTHIDTQAHTRMHMCIDVRTYTLEQIQVHYRHSTRCRVCNPVWCGVRGARGGGEKVL